MLAKTNKASILDFSSDEHPFLREKRLKAFEQFEKLEMPKFKYGIGVYGTLNVDFDQCNEKKNKSSALKDEMLRNLKKNNIKNISALSFEDAVNKFPKIKNLFGSLIPIENKIDAFHYMWCDVVVIFNESDATLPLHHITNNFSNNHLIIIAKENTHLNIIEQTEGNGFAAAFVELFVQPSATVQYTTIQNLSNGIFFSTKKAMVEKDAQVHWADIHLGSEHARAFTHTLLEGNQGKATTKTFFFANQKQLFDLQSTLIHNGQDTTSTILSKGCIDNEAKTILRGLIKIQEQASRAKGSQKEEVLLLSEDAEIDAMPDLEIHNDDVQCSHGAALGHIDKERLFYLMSRGLSKTDAQKLIVQGFFGEAFADLPEELSQRCEKIIDEKLEKIKG